MLQSSHYRKKHSLEVQSSFWEKSSKAHFSVKITMIGSSGHAVLLDLCLLFEVRGETFIFKELTALPIFLGHSHLVLEQYVR